MPRPAPRLILLRHGETEWTITGQHTGLSDIPLTKNGEEIVISGAPRIIGNDHLIDPKKCRKVLVSPRQRALKTFHLAFQHTEEPPFDVQPNIREWDYGKYDGLTTSDILKIDPTWSIWTDGCPGGESIEQVQTRVDGVIAKVREWHREYLEDNASTKPDVMIVAHGHISRVFVARWLKRPVADGRHFNLGTASIAVLGYSDRQMEEPWVDVLNLSL